MAKNKLSDLNNHLFAQLERLNDEDLTSEQIENEVKRASAVTGVASQIIQNAKVTVDAMKLVSTGKVRYTDTPEIFGLKKISEKS